MGSSPVRVTSKNLKRTQFALGFLLFGNTYGNGEEHVGSCEAIYCRRSPRGPFGVSEFPGKRFDLGWLRLTSKKHRKCPVLFCCVPSVACPNWHGRVVDKTLDKRLSRAAR